MFENDTKNLEALTQFVADNTTLVKTILVSNIRSNEQVRKVFNKIDELALSLVAEGQQSPIIVSPAGPDGMHVIQKGERRWRAAKSIGLETIEAIVRSEPKNKLEKTASELIENIQREDLSAIEIANALSIFIEEGWNQKQIADRLGKSSTYVSTHLALLKIPQRAKDLGKQGIVTDTETLNILRFIYDLDKVVYEDLCDQALQAGSLSRKYCREILNELEAAHKASKQIQETEESDKPYNQETQETQEGGAQSEQSKSYADAAVPVPEPFKPSATAETLDPNSATELFKSNSSRDEGDAKNQTDWVDESEAKAKEVLTSTHEEAAEAAITLATDSTNLDVDPAQWERVQPSDLIIAVRVNVRDRSRPATLMLERISLNPKHVWVYLTDENIGHLALVVDVTIESVKKNPFRV